jgi:hypothetical protein
MTGLTNKINLTSVSMTNTFSKGDIRDLRDHPDYGWRRTRRTQPPDDFLLLPHPSWEDPEVRNPRRSGDYRFDDSEPEDADIPSEVLDYLDRPETRQAPRRPQFGAPTGSSPKPSISVFVKHSRCTPATKIPVWPII